MEAVSYDDVEQYAIKVQNIWILEQFDSYFTLLNSMILYFFFVQKETGGKAASKD